MRMHMQTCLLASSALMGVLASQSLKHLDQNGDGTAFKTAIGDPGNDFALENTDAAKELRAVAKDDGYILKSDLDEDAAAVQMTAADIGLDCMVADGNDAGGERHHLLN